MVVIGFQTVNKKLGKTGNGKFKTIFFVTMSIALASCQTPTNKPIDPAKISDPGWQQVGDWKIYCSGGTPNAVGQITIAKNCRIEKYNFLSVVKINASGEYVLGGRSSGGPCGFGARHSAVDGVPIEMMSTKEQISRLKSGSTFARETQSAWPYCSVTIEQTKLGGFTEAYAILLNRWEQFK